MCKYSVHPMIALLFASYSHPPFVSMLGTGLEKQVSNVHRGGLAEKAELTIFCERNNFQHLSEFWKYLIKNIKCNIVNHIFNNNSKNMVRATFRLLKTIQFFQSFLLKYFSDEVTWVGVLYLLARIWFCFEFFVIWILYIYSTLSNGWWVHSVMCNYLFCHFQIINLDQGLIFALKMKRDFPSGVQVRLMSVVVLLVTCKLYLLWEVRNF